MQQRAPHIADRLALGHYTHEKNPVACAATLATIQYIEDHGLVAHARDLGCYALQRLMAMGNIITLSPPLVIAREEMDRALDILDECLTEVEREGARADTRAKKGQETDR